MYIKFDDKHAQLSPINPLHSKGYILDDGTAQFFTKAQLISLTVPMT